MVVFLLHQTQSTTHRCHLCTPPPFCWSQHPLAHHPPTAAILFLSVAYVATSFTPAYYGWLLCDGRSGSDTIDVVIASRIVIVIIIISLPSPAEEHRAETCKVGRGCGDHRFEVDTGPIAVVRKGRQSEQGEDFYGIVINYFNFCGNYFATTAPATKKNNWQLSVHVQLNSTGTDDHQ